MKLATYLQSSLLSMWRIVFRLQTYHNYVSVGQWGFHGRYSISTFYLWSKAWSSGEMFCQNPTEQGVFCSQHRIPPPELELLMEGLGTSYMINTEYSSPSSNWNFSLKSYRLPVWPTQNTLHSKRIETSHGGLRVMNRCVETIVVYPEDTVSFNTVKTKKNEHPHVNGKKIAGYDKCWDPLKQLPHFYSYVDPVFLSLHNAWSDFASWWFSQVSFLKNVLKMATAFIHSFIHSFCTLDIPVQLPIETAGYSNDVVNIWINFE